MSRVPFLETVILLVPLAVCSAWVWHRLTFPWRARKTLRFLWGEKREQQPKLRRLRRGRHSWTLAWKMPTGAESAEWQARATAISEDLNSSFTVWYDRGLTWTRFGVRRLPRKGSRRVGYRSFYRQLRPRGQLVFGVGHSQEGDIWADLAEIVHLLLGGKSGAGKSRFIAQMIVYLAETYGPEQLRMLIIDLKGKGAPELRWCQGLPHLDGPVVGNMDGCRKALAALEAEMDERYRKIGDDGDIDHYNARHPEAPMARKLVVIDECADLTQSLTGPELKGFERLVRELRACGVHLVLATQRPDANVVPGQIRNNMGAVLAFRTGNRTSSEVLLGDGRSAACTIPPGQPGLGIWQRETEVRVRTVYLDRDEAQARVAALADHRLARVAPLPGLIVDGEASEEVEEPEVLEEPRAALRVLQMAGNIPALLTARRSTTWNA